MSYQPLSSQVPNDVHPHEGFHDIHTLESTTEAGLSHTNSINSVTNTSQGSHDGQASLQRTSVDISEGYPSAPSSKTASHAPKPSVEHRETSLAAASLSDKPSRRNASDPGHDIKTLTGWWWWEIVATLVSVICMTLLIALLCVIRETPLSRWTWQLEPNSVISILTTASKTALMVPVAACLSQLKWKHAQQPRPLSHMQIFDDASRGPYGSLVMAWKLHFQSPIGWALAFVTVVALGIGPSAQNVLLIHSNPVELTNTTDNEARIGRADAIHSKAFAMSKLDENSEWAINADMPRIQAAIINGLMGTQTHPYFACPSDSICRWDDFSSLGVCSTLRNVTEDTTPDCKETLYRGPAPSLVWTGEVPDWFKVYNCTYNMSGRLDPRPPSLRLHNALNEPSPLLYTDFSRNRTSAIGQLVVLKFNHHDLSRPLKSYNAFVADFHWSLRTFKNTTSTYGEIKTNETEPVILTREKSIYQNIMYAENGSAHWINGTQTMQKNWQTVPDIYRTPDNKTRFEINARWLGFYLRDLLSLQLYEAGSNSSMLLSGQNDTQRFRTSNIFLNMLFHEQDDLKVITDRLSQTLTNQIRSNHTGDNMNATVKSGRVFKEEPFIIVRWPWLILPLVETVLTAVLLVVSILITRRDPLLKSSTTALMVYPLEGWETAETTVRDPQNNEKMAKFAEGLSGKLIREDGVWKFIKC